MHIAVKHLLPPLTGEGSGGSEDSTSSPHPTLPPHRGKGYTVLLGPLVGHSWVKLSLDGGQL
jgi:hypothetical protein